MGISSNLRAVLLADNPWMTDRSSLKGWYEAHLPPTVLPRAWRGSLAWEDPDRVHLVVGPRQAGKSTWIWSWLAQRGAPAFYVDCEQRVVREWCGSAPLFLDDVRRTVPPGTPLFFDEIQHLDEAGLFLKGLVDRRPGAPVLVTGSSSYHLRAKTRESLAGRATRTRLLPFSLAEVCQDLGELPELGRIARSQERMRTLLVRGGYPDVWLSDQPQRILHGLVEAVILRDASDLYRITRPETFHRLLRLVAGQVGSLVNYSEWASILGISRETVTSWLEILEESHVVATVPPFTGGKRSELTGRPKVYFLDNGIRNHLLGDLRAWEERSDRGPLLENFVFCELTKSLSPQDTLHFWRSTSGAEVDFVVVGPGGLVGIEVKATLGGRATLSRSARSFIEAYAPARFLVVQEGVDGSLQIGATHVVWVSGAGPLR